MPSCLQSALEVLSEDSMQLHVLEALAACVENLMHKESQFFGFLSSSMRGSRVVMQRHGWCIMGLEPSSVRTWRSVAFGATALARNGSCKRAGYSRL